MNDIETLEAAARLGRKLEKVQTECEAALLRTRARYAAKRTELLADAPEAVLEKLGVDT